ncbi:hypothetical protein FACS189427_01500 [Planctomycetales bacterium]|nr:hypothetical protein FACS189427_01500 [Planctomycetales bacterium]
MAIFQINILEKRINEQTQEINAAFEKYCAYFHNQTVQRNIRRSKEEQYQEGFLRELFVNVLGYTINPDENYNLITEQKNEDNQEKSDAAILIDSEVRAVIELKNVHTHLNDTVKQAFGYKYHHRSAIYVITSNFEKLRFYIDNAVDYLEWNLFNLSKKEFESLWICLAYKNIKNGVAKQLKDESLDNEKNITMRFYGDYKQFKNVLFADLIENNPQYDKLTLFKAAQKILDRIIFLCFAEDNNLIPPNTIETHILSEWKYLAGIGEYRSLYDCFKKYFRLVDTGAKDKRPCDIYGYNGGLFRGGEELELTIDDELLKNNTQQLYRYNFLQRTDYRSEIDINILGHIFEHSLTEIEKIEEELLNEEHPAAKTDGQVESQRKDDGIFYTPQYITSFLLDETLGKLCNEKKAELGINIDFSNLDELRNKKVKKKGHLPPELTELKEKHETYRDWLLTLTVCDPACGSGAFLNAALDFFIAEHNYIDERLAKIEGLPMTQPMVSVTEILNCNIFGVDINGESVEITKLALWIHSAKKRQKLGFLDGNIKHGNSLLTPLQTDGVNVHKLHYPFDWSSEFPKVFASGGFDVVVCNPPYFNIERLGHHSPYAQAVQKTYSDIWQDKSDILFYFIHKILQLSKSEAGVIVSNAFLFSAKAQKLRNHILQDDRLAKIVNFERFYVFPDANITTCLLMFNKTHSDRKACVMKHKKYDIEYLSEYIHDEANYFNVRFKPDEVFALVDDRIAGLNEKIDGEHPKLNTVCFTGSGMQTAANEVFAFEKRPVKLEGAGKFIKKRMSGEMIHRYYHDKAVEEILYIEDCEKYEDIPLHIRLYLEENREVLENRADKKRRDTVQWWTFTFPLHKEYYHLPKIWCSYRSAHNEFVLDESSDFIGLTNTTVIFDTNEDVSLKYVLALLNSKLLDFRYKTIGKQTGGGIYEYFENGVGKLPLPMISKAKQKPFIKLVEQMIPLQQELGKKRNSNAEALPFQIKGTRVTTVLRRMDELNFEQFSAEIERQGLAIPEHKIPMWRDLFEEECHPCRTLREQIAEVDKQLNRLVYDLYALTADEVKIVEG